MDWIEEFRDGLAVVCAEDGRILECLRNDGNLIPESTRRIQDIFGPAVLGEAEAFLTALRLNNATFGWELELEGQSQPVHFAGGVTERGMLIIGSREASGVQFFCREFIKMHNEQTTALRSALKDLSLKQHRREEQDQQLYEELSRLNNELVTLQRELTRKNVELDRLNTLKNHFLGMASHDLRKPISVVLMYVEFLQGSVREEAGQRWLELIRDSCQDVLEQLSEFLDIAQIEAGRLKLELRSMDYLPLVFERIAVQENLARSKNIKFEFSADVENAMVSGDARRLRQVLDNLLENAVKYSPVGSVVRVTARVADGKVVTQIADEGQGVPAEIQERLFQPFGTGSAIPTAGERSTGLGLAIVKAMVQAHAGRVWLESAAGQGARFSFSLPLLTES